VLRDRCDGAAALNKAQVVVLLADMECDRTASPAAACVAALRAQGKCAGLSPAAIAWILNWGLTNKDGRSRWGVGPDWTKAAGLFMKDDALAADAAAMYKSLNPSQIGQKLGHANSHNQPGKREAETLASKTRRHATKALKA
jgi:hypothetical protein